MQQDPRIHPPKTGGSGIVPKSSFLGPLQCLPVVLGGLEKERKTSFAKCDLCQCAGTRLIIQKHKDYSPLTYGPHASLPAAMPCDVAPGNKRTI